MNPSAYNTYSSDQQTVTPAQTIQQPIVTLQYLLNQNKMKEIALNKATHLIQLYKIQLQVKEQDYLKEVENVIEREKEYCQGIVAELEDRILLLEKQLKTYENKIKEMEKKHEAYEAQRLNDSACRIPKISRNNSSKDLNNNRKSRYSHGKNVSSGQNLMKKSTSNFISQQAIREIDVYRIQKSFLIQYILKCEQKDQKVLNLLQNQVSTQPETFSQIKSTLKSSQRAIQQFMRQMKQPKLQMQTRLKQYRQVIKIQQLIIEELNGQLNEYQNLFNVMNSSLQEIYAKENQQSTVEDMRFSIITSANSFARNQHSFEEFRETIDDTHQSALGKIKQHKAFIKQKITSMEAENKQLKRIMDDMIKLIKNNKKIQISNFGSIKTTKNNQQIDPIKEKSKSHMLYRK